MAYLVRYEISCFSKITLFYNATFHWTCFINSLKHLQLTNASASPTTASLYFSVVFFFGTYTLGTFAYGIAGKHIFYFLQKKYNHSAQALSHQCQAGIANSLPVQQTSTMNKDHVERFVQDVLQGTVFEVVMASTILLDTLALSLQHENMPPFAYHFSKWVIRVSRTFR